ncbi:fimbrial protein [Burkholderia ubonensis]|uniref:Fimbrial protein n=1 Tax=Burkholderia ubonensis TaxID=101571 RepID=A0A102NG89_9BURK|nr:fimbrial protein [Burkholderia ubonensis]AOI68784.1 fimbrial protein [Burkholderia ubonensis]KUZ18019.1 fimbrial protein [Burkholderia ubonensis]KUZ22781.1 fimbrial protein [Burkholderia ubonensis]KUZ37708.1 fimbrial protein [Burkholderia ubonensis]KUZ46591.1 fimbrial protein [Burkholderia ubonensis]
MKAKRMPSGLAAVLLSLLATAAAHAQTATTGTINFNGSITDVPCEIDTAATSSNVPMAKVFANDFSGVGSTTGTTSFQIVLKNCGTSTTGATVLFAGTTDATNTTALQTTVGGASGVALQLVDDTGTPISIGSSSKAYTIAEGDNTFNFAARYIATSATVTGGAANATALFALTYK